MNPQRAQALADRASDIHIAKLKALPFVAEPPEGETGGRKFCKHDAATGDWLTDTRSGSTSSSCPSSSWRRTATGFRSSARSRPPW